MIIGNLFLILIKIVGQFCNYSNVKIIDIFYSYIYLLKEVELLNDDKTEAMLRDISIPSQGIFLEKIIECMLIILSKHNCPFTKTRV